MFTFLNLNLICLKYFSEFFKPSDFVIFVEGRFVMRNFDMETSDLRMALLPRRVLVLESVSPVAGRT